MKPILPGSTIGLLGGGQLGRMFAIAARRMGYRVHTYSPDDDTPAGQISDVEISAPYEDLDAIRAFAGKVDVVTFEFENVPVSAAEAAAAIAPVRPAGGVLHTTQQRIREKAFLRGAGFPVAEYRVIQSLDDLRRAIAEIGCPAVLKTAAFGYDGKGQATIQSAGEIDSAWQAIGEQDAVLEAFVRFECEISVVAARSLTGDFAHYGALENHHRNHILDFTLAPARVAPKIAADAAEMARAIVEKLDYCGVLCVEFFVAESGKLLVNELAPRPHNSGHYSVDACRTSQFEQQLRAVCGLPLGSPEQFRPAAMVNLLGDLWNAGEPDWFALCAHTDVKLHLYGKVQARPGRKMGHVTALAETAEAALARATAARASLTR